MYRFHAPSFVKEVGVLSVSGISVSPVQSNSMATSAPSKVIEAKIAYEHLWRKKRDQS